MKKATYYYRALRPSKLAKLCKNFYDPLDIKEAVRPLIRGGCPHFGVVKETSGEYHLLYAGVSKGMNLERVLDNMELFRHYDVGDLVAEDSGLDSRQVLHLVGHGYGVTTCLDMSTGEIEVLTLQAHNDRKYDCVKKNTLYFAPLDQA